MSERPLHDPSKATPRVLDAMASFHRSTIDEVVAAVSSNDVVVVGMGWNPHVKNARKALDEAGIAHTYLEYGNYMSAWRERLAIKMWSGWPTFPQVFVRGTLIGGNKDTRAAIADGSLKTLLG